MPAEYESPRAMKPDGRLPGRLGKGGAYGAWGREAADESAVNFLLGYQQDTHRRETPCYLEDPFPVPAVHLPGDACMAAIHGLAQPGKDHGLEPTPTATTRSQCLDTAS